MYEFLRIIKFANEAISQNKKIAFATIYKIEGSSYRKKWTQMVLADDLTYAGHLSGGCVEKEIQKQAEKVFRLQENTTFSYDGSFRLGCEGVIHILIELVDSEQFALLYKRIVEANRTRAYFEQGLGYNAKGEIYSFYKFDKIDHLFLAYNTPVKEESRTIHPQNQIVILGNEFDADILAKMAHQSGYKVVQIVSKHHPIDLITSSEWTLLPIDPEEVSDKIILDKLTAVVLMSHSYHRDLSYIEQFIKHDLAYIGTLGPRKRKHKIMTYLLDYSSDKSDQELDRIENIKGPVGINIPSQTPEEISISILAELVIAFNDV